MIKLIISSGIVVFLLFSCKNKNAGINPLVQKITESVYASGIVKSKQQYQVYSSVNGLVAQVFVTEGDMVKKGDPILRITNTTASLNVENAQLSADFTAVAANQERLSELKINTDLAKSKMENDVLLLQRQRNLWNQQIGTRNELDQRELAYKSSATAYDAAKLRYAELQKQINYQSKQSQKNLQLSKTQVGDYTLKSETDGKIYSILKEKGEMVNTQTAVALVGDGNNFTIELQVDEYDISRVIVGQKILISMDSYKGQVFEGVVEKINPLMSERSKSFTIDATFIKQPPALYPNLTCEANIVIHEKGKVLTIPRAYLMEGDYVMLANKEKRKVVTGLKDFQLVEIISGLTANEFIIKPL